MLTYPDLTNKILSTSVDNALASGPELYEEMGTDMIELLQNVCL
jgi:hypothetical protein